MGFMDSRQLHYFRSVVDHGGFTHAAAAMEMTQPSLSLSIRKLEDELGIQLLNRSRAGATPTDAGNYVYKTAVKLDALLSQTTQRIREMAGGLAGSVSVCSAPEFNWTVMPAVLHQMLQEAPDVEVYVEDPSPSITLERVLDGTVNVGLLPVTDSAAVAQRFVRQLDVVEFARFPWVVGLPERLADLPDPVSLYDIRDETWVVVPRNPEFIGLTELLDELWADHPDAVPARRQEISTLQTAIPLVAGGLGVALFPETARTFKSEGIHYRQLKEKLPMMSGILLTRRDADLSPATQRLIELIKKVGKQRADNGTATN